jgi:hypothetical protein
MAVCLCAIPATLIAQGLPSTGESGGFTGAPRAGDLLAPAKTNTGFSLLDPSRLSIHHSYTLSYFSGGGQSGSVGMYMSTIEYQFAQPLSVRVGLGYLHQPLGFLNSNANPVGNEILPNFQVEWRPSENFHFQVDYLTVPTSAYGNGYGWGGYRPGYGSRSRLWGW